MTVGSAVDHRAVVGAVLADDHREVRTHAARHLHDREVHRVAVGAGDHPDRPVDAGLAQPLLGPAARVHAVLGLVGRLEARVERAPGQPGRGQRRRERAAEPAVPGEHPVPARQRERLGPRSAGRAGQPLLELQHGGRGERETHVRREGLVRIDHLHPAELGEVRVHDRIGDTGDHQGRRGEHVRADRDRLVRLVAGGQREPRAALRPR
ncbi:MAG TPA: hypothetical protein PKC20_14205, partial [Burkholderiaceae bacterium]|nr:hypothetical protein [Burkholderiaceae bacterium]